MKICTLPTQHTCELHMTLRTDSNYFP